MSDTWFYERTAEGWEVRDENRLLVAVVPDVQHQREHDAKRIACSTTQTRGSMSMVQEPPTRQTLPPLA